MSGGSSSAPPPKPAAYNAKPYVPQPRSQPVYEQTTYVPPPRNYGPAQGEIVSESIMRPTNVNAEEEAAKEEERMMRSIGKFVKPESGGGGGVRAAPVTTSYQPPARATAPSYNPFPSQQARSYAPPPLEDSVVEEIALPPPTRPRRLARRTPRPSTAVPILSIPSSRYNSSSRRETETQTSFRLPISPANYRNFRSDFGKTEKR